MVDFHSHILPGIDDGADCVETSLEMLRQSKEQGVTCVVATPHFFSKEITIEEFLVKRKRAYRSLVEAMEGKDLPQLRLGCEVHLDSETHKMEKLEKLCLDGTSVILLEMPYDLWQPWLNDVVYHIRVSRKLIPVIAHVDRYHAMLKKFERMESLLSMEVVVQLNPEAFFGHFINPSVKKIIRGNRPLILGSDMHNLTIRQTQIKKACKIIEKKFGTKLLDEMEETAQCLLDNKTSVLF